MLRFLRIRVPLLLLTLLGISVLTFVLIHLVPGGPFRELEGGGRALSPEVVARIERFYGLDRPLYEQYVIYIGNVLRGDFGRSLLDNERVLVLLMQGLPVSAQLGALAIGVAIFVGIPLGLLAAVYRNSWVDHLATGVSVVGITVPSFVLGFALIVLFALRLDWLPVAGWGSWRHSVMPVIALSMEPIALFARYTRASMQDVLGHLYITVARSKGLAPPTVLVRHALKNALIPVVTVLGLVIPHLIVGSFLVETVFAVPGTGRFFVTSISRRDYPVVMGITLLFAAMVALANLLADLVYTWLDPRIKYE
jgi:ABC-type dipeptide/oligopeptide/nickel transport system permease component